MSRLDDAIRKINQNYKQEIITLGPKYLYREQVKFTSPRMNWMSYGGIPVGMATEVFGPENGGKTTTALDLVRQAQDRALLRYNNQMHELGEQIKTLQEKGNKSDKKKLEKLQKEFDELGKEGPRRCVYIDAENTLDEDWARHQMKVDVDNLYISRPMAQTAEQILQDMLELLGSGGVELMVLDSIPYLIPQQVYEKRLDESKMYAGVSGPLTDFSLRAPALLMKHRSALVLINQVRDDLRNPYNFYHSPGGRAVKHMCAVRLYVRRGSFIDQKNKELKNSTENPAGNLVEVNLVKTKTFKPDRRVSQYTLKYDSGIDVIADTVHTAIEYGFIRQSGAWFYLMNPETGELLEENGEQLRFQGRAEMLDYFAKNETLFAELYDAVNQALGGDGSVENVENAFEIEEHEIHETATETD